MALERGGLLLVVASVARLSARPEGLRAPDAASQLLRLVAWPRSLLGAQSAEGQNQDKVRLGAVVFENLARAVFLLTLLLLSLGWGFIRPHLRVKEGWVVSLPAASMAMGRGVMLSPRDSIVCSGLHRGPWRR